jgi:transcription antitermination factor NusG
MHSQLLNPESAVPRPPSNKHGAPGEALDADWFILRCASGLDFLAEEELRGSGWDIFLARERKWQPGRWRRKRHQAVTVDYPRFPGYLFIAVCPPQWPDLSARPFVTFIRGVLAMDGVPVPLAPREIERLKAEDGTTVPHVGSVPTRKSFAPGQAARILAGPFQAFVVVIEAISADGAKASVPLFGRQAEVVLPLTWLEAA